LIFFVSASIQRRITAPKGLRLSTGHLIPYDASIGFVHPLSPFVHTPSNLRTPLDYCPHHPPLSEFYPFRYSEIRSLPGQDNYHQFAMTAEDNINFGHGPGSCPGRFFAGAVVKAIVIEILRRYDVALGPNGEGETTTDAAKEAGGEATLFKRPTNIVQSGSLQCLPDFTYPLYFKELDAVIPVAEQSKLS
jgi:hypothetical protein